MFELKFLKKIINFSFNRKVDTLLDRADMLQQADEKILFEDSRLDKTKIAPWKVIIADDEKEVHAVTKIVLKGISFEGRELEFLSAYSGAETIKLVEDNPDTALILLDVVMEHDDAGLEVVKNVRDVLKNRLVRIVLRTGQSGQAPERDVINNYDINDYKEKTELTSQKLYTTIIASLRGYRDLLAVEENKKKVNDIKVYLQNILKSMSSGIIALDNNCNINLCNAMSRKLLKVDDDNDVLGKNLFDVVSFFDEYRPIIESALRERVVREIYQVNYKNIGYIDIFIYPFEFNNYFGLVIRIDDVTSIVAKDEQINRIHRIETIGTLAAGLAHDFNNILGGISGAVSLMKIESEHLSGDSLIKTGIGMIDESVVRASGVIKQLLSISKKQEPKFSEIELNSAVKNMISICTNSLDKSVKTKVDYYNQDAFINGDLSQIEQVILNLCINAGHAMTIMRKAEDDWGGLLSIRVYKAEDNDRIYKTYTDCIGKLFYVVEISDTGVGIDDSIKSKIFDPFFTTKSKGAGTGLGLSMVYNIVNQHKGLIDIDSVLGGGATFRLYFPLVEKKICECLSGKDLLKKGSGTILICDDDDAIRRILSRTLTICGYDVIVAKDGDEAVSLFEKSPDLISLVLLDNQMQKMYGSDVYWKLKAIRFDVKVLFTSGLEKTEELVKCLIDGAKGFVPKPFDMKSLTELIYEIINEVR